VPGAVLRLVVGRRVTAVVGWLALAVVLVLPLGRFLSSSGDVGAAVSRAEVAAAELAAATGSAVDPAATYAEPRYLFAVQAPYDLAAVALGLALLALLGGSVLTGGDWRSRTVGVLFPRWRARAAAATWQVLAWAGLAATGAAVLLAAGAALLLAVATLRGSAAGADVAGTAWLVLRGTLLVLTAGLVGAGAAVVVRSEVVVILAVLGEVLLAEILLPALLAGWRSPGAALVHAVLAPDPGREALFVCDAPRCEPAVLAGPGSVALPLGALVLALAATGAAAAASRRPIWS
jgi:hypothetical protein